MRRILHTPPAFHSRVSNDVVFARARATVLSKRLLHQQLMYFGKLSRRPGDDPVRSSILEPGGLELKQLHAKRRVGRPCLEWGKEIRKHAVQAAGGERELTKLLVSTEKWHGQWLRQVKRYVG